MNVIHRVSFRNDSRIVPKLQEVGIKIKDGILTGVDVGENDSNWSEIKGIIDKYPKELSDFQYKTEFTKKEKEYAEYFMISSSWLFEYPQPENDFGYTNSTYDASNYCSECGIGLIQKSPFSLKKSPKWGARNIVQVNWVFDEFFVSESLKKGIEKKNLDIQFMPVLKYRKGTKFEDMYQLVISRKITLEIPQSIEYETCKVCHQKKHLPLTRGFAPKPLSNDFMIAHSEQYFGSGHSANHAVVINKDVYNLFEELGVKGISYVPCA